MSTTIDCWDKHTEIRDWLLAHGYVPDKGNKLGVAWSTRIGMDFTDLEFWPWDRGVEAIVGHHASGENPRMGIGTCESLEDVIRTHDAIRLINGYRKPSPTRETNNVERWLQYVASREAESAGSDNATPVGGKPEA